MENLDTLLERAERLERSGDAHGAIEVWRTLARMRPDATIYACLGGVAEQLGYTAEAKDAFTRAIEFDATLTIAYVSLASIALEEEENQRAADLLETALGTKESALAYCLRGIALRRLDKDEDAAKCFGKAVQVDPSYEEAYFNYGVLLRDGNTERAEELFRKALEHSPEYSEAHRELGWLLSKNLHSVDAEEHLRRAIQLDPEDAWARVYLGNHLWRNADPEGAIDQLKHAVAIAPNRAFALRSLANFYEDQEEWDEARRLYIRALDADSEDAVTQMNFGRMLKKKGEIDLAKRYLLQAISLDPEYHAARALLMDI